jgi:hypothetical protein
MSKRFSRKLSSFHDEESFASSSESATMVVESIPSNAQEHTVNPQYDTTSAATKEPKKKDRKERNSKRYSQKASYSSYPVDPWESASPGEKDRSFGGEVFFPSTFSNESDSVEVYEDEIYQENDDNGPDHQNPSAKVSARSTFLMPSDIHPRMEHREDDIAQLRLLAGKLNADWGGQSFMAPALARRIRDFQFAQEKRRKKYGDERPWGILGLYDHLASIR